MRQFPDPSDAELLPPSLSIRHFTNTSQRRKQPPKFSKHAKACAATLCFKSHMYRLDVATGETVFALTARAGAREVVLEGFSEMGRLRVPMRRTGLGWSVRVAMNSGWFFYRFCIDGHTLWDRGSGKLRSADGEAWCLALV